MPTTPTSERQKVLAIAHALGHTDPAVWETRSGKFFATCSCGWESTYRRTFVDALSGGVNHALVIGRPVYAKAKRSGRPLGVVIAAERRKGFQLIKGAQPRDRYKRAA